MEKKLLNKMITWLRLCIAGLIMVIISPVPVFLYNGKIDRRFFKAVGYKPAGSQQQNNR